MGLFDKIKDNAKNISMKAIEATREYDDDYLAEQQAAAAVGAPPIKTQEPATSSPNPSPDPIAADDEDADIREAAEEAAAPVFIMDEPEEKPASQVKQDAGSDDSPRKSKVTEMTKAEKRAEDEAKARANARKAPYEPHYKASLKKKDEPKAEAKQKADEPAPEPDQKPARRSGVLIDIAPQKITDPLKKAMYARERAALAALASQRKLNGTVPLYVTSHMNFKTRVFIDRVEYSGSFGKNVLPVPQIAWVKLRASGTGVILETLEGKRVVLVIKPKDRLDFADAVLKVQAMQPKRAKFKDTKTVRIDQLEKFNEGVDEIEKLAKLFDKGILTQEEFDTKKKQILGL